MEVGSIQPNHKFTISLQYHFTRKYFVQLRHTLVLSCCPPHSFVICRPAPRCSLCTPHWRTHICLVHLEVQCPNRSSSWQTSEGYHTSLYTVTIKVEKSRMTVSKKTWRLSQFMMHFSCSPANPRSSQLSVGKLFFWKGQSLTCSQVWLKHHTEYGCQPYSSSESHSLWFDTIARIYRYQVHLDRSLMYHKLYCPQHY